MASSSLVRWEGDFDSRSLSSANDFRSDTVTLPSGAMLASILSDAPTLGDDVYSEDGPTNALESYVGELTGLQNAVFVLSGSMGNQIALRCHLVQPPYSVICGRKSHIYEWECGMGSMFSQAHMIPVSPSSETRAYLTLEDILPDIVPDDGDTHGAPTRVIGLENTISGKVVPVEEIKRISRYAREKGIKVHLDGARLWNACYTSTAPAATTTQAVEAAKTLLRDYCASVDSVTLCFSKSLGAPCGSILLSKTSSFISRARHFRKALGGGLRQSGVITSPARVAIDRIFLSGVHLLRANAIAKRLEESWKRMGGQIQAGLSQETNFVWLNLDQIGVQDEDFIKIANEQGVKVGHFGRLATHYRELTPAY
ncbi:hypothetical protein MMC07_001106 [Pseudocyphellaria aurata]|nr:hypothetical protein [Pseudocyphellaria aurata]